MNYLLGCACPHAVRCIIIIVAIYIRIFVAIVIRKKATLIVQSVLQNARTKSYLSGKVLKISVIHNPFIAEFLRPPRAVLSFPLRSKVPTERNWPAPQAPI